MRHEIDSTGLLMAIILQAVHDHALLRRKGIIDNNDKVVSKWPRYTTRLMLKCNRAKEVAKRFANYYEHRHEVQQLIEFIRKPSIQEIITNMGRH